MVKQEQSYRFKKELEVQHQLFDKDLWETQEKRRIKQETNIKVYQNDANSLIRAEKQVSEMRALIYTEQEYQNLIDSIADMGLSQLDEQRLIREIYHLRTRRSHINYGD